MDQGHGGAAYLLSKMCTKGQGMVDGAKDEARADALVQLGAERGHHMCQYLVGQVSELTIKYTHDRSHTPHVLTQTRSHRHARTK